MEKIKIFMTQGLQQIAWPGTVKLEEILSKL